MYMGSTGKLSDRQTATPKLIDRQIQRITDETAIWQKPLLESQTSETLECKFKWRLNVDLQENEKLLGTVKAITPV